MNPLTSQGGLADRLQWHYRRLSTMSAAEVAWRCVRLTVGAARRSDLNAVPDNRLLRDGLDWEVTLQRFRDSVDRPVLLDRASAQAIRRRRPDTVDDVIAAAERVAAGRFAFFGYPEVTLSDSIDWHFDPVADYRWPQLQSAKLDHRTAGGDPKWIWELNRLQHLPWLAQAWLFTGHEPFAELALSQLDSWMSQNPAGVGIAWRGSFEAGVRAVSVAVALQGLRDSPALTVERFERVVRMLATSAARCWRDRSRFSSANNHLVGELAGMAVVGLLLPDLRPARRWLDNALSGLSEQAARQILPDGAGAEQAIGYQMFTVELLVVVAVMLRAGRNEVPPTVLAAIRRSAEYLARLVDGDDPHVRYGDDDEGFALRLGPEPLRTVRQHLGLVGACGGDQWARFRQETLSSLWIEAAVGSTTGGISAPVVERPVGSHFAEFGGLVVLRSGGRRLTMDVGPLGYLSIAAHGHADALAVSLCAGGTELIGDPGTASYYGHPDWRRTHRGTRVHATVTVDGQDQSVMGGPFLWTRHALVRVHTVDLQRGIVDAEHDGYRRLSDPVTHRRWLVAPPTQAWTLVVDALDGLGEHEMRASWPLHPALDVIPTRQGHRVEKDGIPALQIAYAATSPVLVDQVKGNVETNLGWWSERLEARTPSWLVSGLCRGSVPMVMTTVLQPLGRGAATSLTDLVVGVEKSKIFVRWRDKSEHRVEIDRPPPGATSESVFITVS